jgi:uncharacterized membrane protein (Fun14 family)
MMLIVRIVTGLVGLGTLALAVNSWVKVGHDPFATMIQAWETQRCRMAQAVAPILDSTQSDLPACPPNVRHRG